MGPGVSLEQFLAIVDSFSAAGVGAGSWDDALAGLAAASGSRAGQLIGFGTAEATRFNWLVDPEPAWTQDFVSAGGGDPEMNPRLAAGLRLPVLQLVTDQDVISKEARRRNPFYADFLERYDLPFLCATNLVNDSEVAIGLAVLRSRRDGEIQAGQRALFAAVAPHARAAVRTQLALENQGSQLIAGSLEALSITAFVCDRSGKVRAMTPMAEALVSAGDVFGLRSGRLRIVQPGYASLLAAALRACLTGPTPERPAINTLVIPQGPDAPTVIDVIALPVCAYSLGFEPRVIVVVRNKRREPADISRLIQSAYRLTAAEAEVAVQLADGLTANDIAAARSVTVGTVRVQIRAILEKLGVRRQSEVVIRVGQLR